jgi:hypothetical protein
MYKTSKKYSHYKQNNCPSRLGILRAAFCVQREPGKVLDVPKTLEAIFWADATKTDIYDNTFCL